jgi:WD40 repeat protein
MDGNKEPQTHIDLLINRLTFLKMEKKQSDAHSDIITCILFLEDRKEILTSASDGNIKIWNSNSLKFLASLKGHTTPVHKLIRLNTHQIVSGSSDTIKIWDLTSREVIQTLENRGSSLTILTQLTPDYLLSGSCLGRAINIWKTDSSKKFKFCHAYFSERQEEMSNILVLSSKIIVVTICQNINIHSVRYTSENLQLKFEFTLLGHTGWVSDLRLTGKENEYLLSYSNDYTSRVWDLKRKKCIKTLSQHSGELCPLMPLTPTIFVTAGKEIKVWKVYTGTCTSIPYTGSNKCIDYMISLPNNQIVAAGSTNLQIWSY